jgi:hypothetical protein
MEPWRQCHAAVYTRTPRELGRRGWYFLLGKLSSRVSVVCTRQKAGNQTDHKHKQGRDTRLRFRTHDRETDADRYGRAPMPAPTSKCGEARKLGETGEEKRAEQTLTFGAGQWRRRKVAACRARRPMADEAGDVPC